MKRILLTGASGFLGRHCLPRLLKAGFQVLALSSAPVCDLDDAVQQRRVDLMDARATTAVVREFRPTHLLHLAWQRMAGGAWAQACVASQQAWVQASEHLVRTFTDHGGVRAVVSGTCAEYDWTAGTCREASTPLRPQSAYGAAKDALRRSLEFAATDSGLSLAWARLFFLYGPHEDPTRFVPQVTRALLHGAPAHCSHGLQSRDYLYAGDAADALVALLGAELQGACNIGSGRSVPLRQIATEIAAQFGRPDLLRFGAVPSGLLDPPLVVADPARLLAATGWRPQVDLATGLRRTIAWWQEQDHRQRAA